MKRVTRKWLVVMEIEVTEDADLQCNRNADEVKGTLLGMMGAFGDAKMGKTLIKEVK